MGLGGIDLNDFVKSYYETAKSINTFVSNAVGIEAHWMRSIPHEKSEDVIFHEYTLYDVDCPKVVKVVTTNSGYNPGNFQVDIFGINYEQPFEIEIDKTTWESVYGTDVLPQKGDIVYIEMLNCLYEVSTSTIIYGFAERETGFKVQLVKYNPKASRRESIEVQETIDDLTVGVDELFGKKISEEVSDIVDDEQTSQYISTLDNNVDPYKDTPLDNIMIGDVGTENNVSSRSYYVMSNMTQSIIYKTGDTISKSNQDYNRFFSCLFNIQDVDTYSDAGKLEQQEQKNTFLLRDMEFSNMNEGDQIVLSRGNMMHLNGYVSKKVEVNGSARYMITLNNVEYRAAVKKMTNFWQGAMKIKKCHVRPLLLGRNEGECNFNISLIGNKSIYLKFGSVQKEIHLLKDIPYNQWVGIAINLGPASDVFVYIENNEGNWSLNEHFVVGDMSNDFNVGKFYITESDLLLSNIRLYKTSYQVPSYQAEKDISTQFIKNDSKAIINDSATVENPSPYITQQR